MTWSITATGREYHYGFGSRNVCLDDIAHHLALTNRYNGGTCRPYSVAEHSLLVADIAEREGASPIVQLAALMHDAHEAYVGDLSSPIKQVLFAATPAWHEFELLHATNVRKHFGLLTVFASHGKQIKYWDLVALATERRDLTAYDARRHLPWQVLADGTDQAIPASTYHSLDTFELRCHWMNWRDRFMWRCMALQDAIAAQNKAIPKQPPVLSPSPDVPAQAHHPV